MSLEEEFEGSLILEKLAQIDCVDEFFVAIDSDDFDRVKRLLSDAQVDDADIAIVLKKMSESDGKH